MVQPHRWWTYNRSPVYEASEPKRVRGTAETSEQRRPTPRPRAPCVWRLVNDLPMSCAGRVVARSSALPAARAPSPLDSSSFESMRILMAGASRWHAHYCSHGRRRRLGLRHDRPPKPPADQVKVSSPLRLSVQFAKALREPRTPGRHCRARRGESVKMRGGSDRRQSWRGQTRGSTDDTHSSRRVVLRSFVRRETKTTKPSPTACATRPAGTTTRSFCPVPLD